MNKNFRNLHIIGGGAKSKFLCQLIADTTKLNIVAGPFEATAYGNILIQKIALNEIKSLEEGFNIIEKSSEVYKYQAN